MRRPEFNLTIELEKIDAADYSFLLLKHGGQDGLTERIMDDIGFFPSTPAGKLMAETKINGWIKNELT